jgi:hypothetical protein
VSSNAAIERLVIERAVVGSAEKMAAVGATIVAVMEAGAAAVAGAVHEAERKQKRFAVGEHVIIADVNDAAIAAANLNTVAHLHYPFNHGCHVITIGPFSVVAAEVGKTP